MPVTIAVWLRRVFQMLLYLLGVVPQHVAFVMDGNRRYAERQHVDKATGHTHGYGKMVEVIHWCIELGVKHITVYAFSIDNFKRAPDEVAALMQLAEEKYAELAGDNGLAEREGIRMHIVGDLSLPPPPVQGAAARLMRNTATLCSQRATLNVCFSYTASEESVTAACELQAAVRAGLLQPEDVTPVVLHGALRTGAACPPVDLLVRTSGETRLSDFMLWQASHAHLCYMPTLWPDFTFLDFARCVLSYQRHAPVLAALRRRAEGPVEQAAQRLPGAQEERGQDRNQAEESADVGLAAGSSVGAAGGAVGLAAAGVAAAAEVLAERSSSCGCDGGGGRGGGHSMRDCLAAAVRRSRSWRGILQYRLPAGSASTGVKWLLRVMGCWGAGGASDVTSGAGTSAAGEGVGRQVRLLRFYKRLEQARLAWIARHADL